MTTTTMTPRSRLAANASPRSVSFWSTLASEWAKLATLRSTYLTLGLGLALSIATTAVVVVAMGQTQTEWPDDFDPITISMVGNILALIIYSVFGVLVASREYSSGTIRLTLTATPSRSRVLLAKLILVSAITLVFGVLTTVGMFLAGQAILGANGMPTASLGDPDAQRMVLGLGVTMPAFPIFGLALGMLLRSTAGGITTVLGLLWLPQIFGEFVPVWFQENVIRLLPQSGLDSLTISHLHDSAVFSTPALGAVIAMAWLAAVVGAAFLVFARRDV